MKKLLALAALAACASGCVVVGPSNAASVIELDVGTPGRVVDNNVGMSKVGKATASGIICFTEGDSSIKAAMDNGGITKIHHIDYKVKNILGIIGSSTTIVYGE